MPDLDLDEILADTWQTLEDAAKSAKHPFHNPTISTVIDNKPDSRVVTLREANPETRILRFHADLRSPKVHQIQANPNVSFLFYAKPEKLQLRIQTLATVHTDDEHKSAGWESSTLLARRCYSQIGGPGTVSSIPSSGLPEHLQGRQPTAEEAEAGRENFAVVRCQIQELDWYSLAFTGHVRAHFTWSGDVLKKEWLLP